MRPNWQPEIFVGLYVAALLLTWVTLFSIERFGATDFKAWAPFIQAVLSAGAIFSAWWLQSRKRAEDRREAERDTIHSVVWMSNMVERTASHIATLGVKGKLNLRSITANRPAIDDHLDFFRRVNLSHMRSQKTAKAFLRMMLEFQHVRETLDLMAGQLSGKQIGQLETMLKRYEKVYSARSEFLGLAGVPDAEARITPQSIRDIFEGSNPES